jgi:hypothetical protein
MAEQSKYLRSFKEWNAGIFQPWWELVGMVLNLAAIVGFLVFLYYCVIYHKPVPWWDAALLGFFIVVFLAISFVAFHRVRERRDELIEEAKGQIELHVYPLHPVGKEIKLVVQNKGKVPVSVSANMTCKSVFEPGCEVSALSLTSTPMGWESSGSFRQELDPDDRKLLKLCLIERTEDNGHPVYWIGFYKIESDKLALVRFMGHESVLEVEVTVCLSASRAIKGQREWVFYVSLIPASSSLAISSEKPRWA